MRRPDLAGLPPVPDLPTDYEIRACDAGEAEALADLLSAAFPETQWTSERAVRDLLRAEDVVTTHIITHNGRLVATASSRLMPEAFPGSGYLHWVASHPDFRGRQLGRAATLAVLHEFVALGCEDAVLETHDFRLPALKTYLKLGFEPVMRDNTHIPRWEEIHRRLAGHTRAE